MAFQGTADLERLAGDADLLQLEENVLGHAGGQVDEAVILADHHAADVSAFETSFIRNRAYDIPWFYAVRVTDFDAVGLDGFVAAAARTAFVTEVARLAALGALAGSLTGPVVASGTRIGTPIAFPSVTAIARTFFVACVTRR